MFSVYCAILLFCLCGYFRERKLIELRSVCWYWFYMEIVQDVILDDHSLRAEALPMYEY